ncbi:hypothetical protein EHS25_004617 [Saitozyma podzolica]|uniref:Uncharacterized protein n=1 Tax=Saitozyma podzolica TaxID=1890683 RepID=A0A427YUX9_9TREE|nr:hypothetical protein EHS25_004617 [Saitozyma podzolica]
MIHDDDTKAIYTVFTSPHHAPMPNHLPTLIVTPHGQPDSVLYTYLHTEENRVNYLLTPSPQGDLCVAKLFPPPVPRPTAPPPTRAASPTPPCDARPPATSVVSPIYKIVNQDDTPLYQISKPNPNAEFWTMFYFKYAGHQIPPKRIEFGKVAKNPPEKGGGTRITITGKNEDEKQVWQTLGVGNEDCVEWVVCCACLNLLDDQILQAAEKKTAALSPATTAPAATTSPAATAVRPSPSPVPRGGPGIASTAPARGPGIASTAPPPNRGPGIASTAPPPAANLSQAYRQNPPPMRGGTPSGPGGYRGDPRDPRARPPPPPQHGMRSPPPGQPPMGGFDPRMRPPPQQQMNRPPPPPQGHPQRNGVLHRAPPPNGAGRRF